MYTIIINLANVENTFIFNSTFKEPFNCFKMFTWNFLASWGSSYKDLQLTPHILLFLYPYLRGLAPSRFLLVQSGTSLQLGTGQRLVLIQLQTIIVNEKGLTASMLPQSFNIFELSSTFSFCYGTGTNENHLRILGRALPVILQWIICIPCNQVTMISQSI